MDLPKSVRFLVIGAGVHGLSTGYHLAKELKARGANEVSLPTILYKLSYGSEDFLKNEINICLAKERVSIMTAPSFAASP